MTCHDCGNDMECPASYFVWEDFETFYWCTACLESYRREPWRDEEEQP